MLVVSPGRMPFAPRPAAVLRGREADARGAAGADAPDLEDRDGRLADGLRVRLDLGLVLAVGVRVPVAVDAAADDLAVGIDPVASVGGDDVASRAARDAVDAAVVLDGDPVVAGARDDAVRASRPARKSARLVPTSAGRTAAPATAGSAGEKHAGSRAAGAPDAR